MKKKLHKTASLNSKRTVFALSLLAVVSGINPSDAMHGHGTKRAHVGLRQQRSAGMNRAKSAAQQAPAAESALDQMNAQNLRALHQLGNKVEELDSRLNTSAANEISMTPEQLMQFMDNVDAQENAAAGNVCDVSLAPSTPTTPPLVPLMTSQDVASIYLSNQQPHMQVGSAFWYCAKNGWANIDPSAIVLAPTPTTAANLLIESKAFNGLMHNYYSAVSFASQGSIGAKGLWYQAVGKDPVATFSTLFFNKGKLASGMQAFVDNLAIIMGTDYATLSADLDKFARHHSLTGTPNGVSNNWQGDFIASTALRQRYINMCLPMRLLQTLPDYGASWQTLSNIVATIAGLVTNGTLSQAAAAALITTTPPATPSATGSGYLDLINIADNARIAINTPSSTVTFSKSIKVNS